MTVFISQPMSGKTEKEILETRERAIEEIKQIYGESTLICDSYISDTEKEWYVTQSPLSVNDNLPVYWLGESIKSLSWADLIWFVGGWEDSKGCKIENMCATIYGIEKSFPTDSARLKLEGVR